MTIDQVIDDIIRREGGFVNNPSDKGGPTKYGVTAKTLGSWRGLGRAATAEEVRELELPEARAIARVRFIENPGWQRIANEHLRAQLIDFGYNSGPERALRWLQRVLRVPPTGLLDDRTRAALNTYPPHLVNDALVAARLYMVDRWTDGDPSQKQFEEGVESRALEFFLSRPDADPPPSPTQRA